jgi:hypothetical protein
MIPIALECGISIVWGSLSEANLMDVLETPFQLITLRGLVAVGRCASMRKRSRQMEDLEMWGSSATLGKVFLVQLLRHGGGHLGDTAVSHNIDNRFRGFRFRSYFFVMMRITHVHALMSIGLGR